MLKMLKMLKMIKMVKNKTSMQLMEQKEGIFLNPPHAQWLWQGKKGLILRNKNYKEMVDKALYICDDRFCYGVLRLHSPFKMSKGKFEEEKNIHLVSDAEIIKWWGKKSDIWVYSFNLITKFEQPMRVEYKGENFLKDVNLESKLPEENEMFELKVKILKINKAKEV